MSFQIINKLFGIYFFPNIFTTVTMATPFSIISKERTVAFLHT